MRQITSNDNASYWQGYIGYPIIAVLLEQGKLEFKQDIAKQLADIPWKQINAQFKRDYEKALNSVLQNIQARGADRNVIVHEVEQIYEQLDKLQLERGPRRRAPRKSG